MAMVRYGSDKEAILTELGLEGGCVDVVSAARQTHVAILVIRVLSPTRKVGCRYTFAIVGDSTLT